MRIATVQVNGKSRPGVVNDASDAIRLIRGYDDATTMVGAIDLGRLDLDKGIPFRSVPLLPPIPRPGKILCLAGNYREHIVESGFVAPGEDDVITPQVFLKPSTCLIPDGADIPLQMNNVAVGWEVELAVIIGRGGRDIKSEDALDHVFGYSILNDVSERKLNSRTENRRTREFDLFFDWLGGKWFDGFAPCGPWIITADEAPDPHSLGIRLYVNGELRQQSSTAAMIFDIPTQISYISSITRLEPGDIIATGTPAGAGLGSGDKVLKHGDEVACEIDGIGILRNKVTAVQAV